VDADHVEDVSVDVDVVVDPIDSDAVADDCVDTAVVAGDVDAAPVAMHAPSTAVASTLAVPAATRERAAGRRRRDRSGGEGAKCSLMRAIMRMGGKRPAKAP
jgi:hypothetical protein